MAALGEAVPVLGAGPALAPPTPLGRSLHPGQLSPGRKVIIPTREAQPSRPSEAALGRFESRTACLGHPKKERNEHCHQGRTSHPSQQSWLGWVHDSGCDRSPFTTNLLKMGRGLESQTGADHRQQFACLGK